MPLMCDPFLGIFSSLLILTGFFILSIKTLKVLCYAFYTIRKYNRRSGSFRQKFGHIKRKALPYMRERDMLRSRLKQNN